MGCILALVVFGIFLFLFTIVGNIIAGPFLDAMTERVLLQLGEPPLPSRGFWNSLGRSVRNQLLKLLFFGGFQAVLLVLLVTPIAFLHPFLAGFLAVLFLAFEYLDYPLDVKRMPVSKRYGYLFRNLGPEGGNEGGRVVAQGPPETVARVKRSSTGAYLARMLDRPAARRRRSRPRSR